jgi:hypothetical protein
VKHPLFHQPTLEKNVAERYRKHTLTRIKVLASGLNSAVDIARVTLQMSLKLTFPQFSFLQHKTSDIFLAFFTGCWDA